MPSCAYPMWWCSSYTRRLRVPISTPLGQPSTRMPTLLDATVHFEARAASRASHIAGRPAPVGAPCRRAGRELTQLRSPRHRPPPPEPLPPSGAVVDYQSCGSSDHGAVVTGLPLRAEVSPAVTTADAVEAAAAACIDPLARLATFEVIREHSHRAYRQPLRRSSRSCITSPMSRPLAVTRVENIRPRTRLNCADHRWGHGVHGQEAVDGEGSVELRQCTIVEGRTPRRFRVIILGLPAGAEASAFCLLWLTGGGPGDGRARGIFHNRSNVWKRCGPTSWKHGMHCNPNPSRPCVHEHTYLLEAGRHVHNRDDKVGITAMDTPSRHPRSTASMNP